MDVIRASYRVRVESGEVEARAQALALEQTVELPRVAVRDAFVEREILGRVVEITSDPVAGYRLELEYPAATSAFDPAQLLNVLFGNCSLQDDVELLDVELPMSITERLGGPRLGVAGLRRLAGVPERPLTCTALKPMGLGPEALARLGETFARAGIDVIKDDHGVADHPFCRFEERVPACQGAIERAARAAGRTALYAPNLIGSPDTVRRQLRFARDCGVRAVLLSPMLLGLPLLHELAAEAPGVALLAHPSFGGARRIAPETLFGKLFRLYGADAVIFPSWGGRFSYRAETCRALVEAARREWKPLRPSLPVPGGGISVERMPELIEFYGADSMFLIGSSLYQAGDALEARAREFALSVQHASRA